MYTGPISESENDADSGMQTTLAPETDDFMENVEEVKHEDRDGESDNGASENAAPTKPDLVAAASWRSAASFMNSSLFSGAPTDDLRQGLEH